MSFILPGMMGLLSKSSWGYTNTYSLNLDAVSDYLTFPDTDNISFGDSSTDSPCSFSLWFKITDSDNFKKRLIAKSDSSANSEYMLTTNASGNLFAAFHDGSSSNSIYKTSTISPTLNTWYHFAVTYSGNGANTGIKLYVDGTLDSGATAGGAGSYTAMHNTNAALYFGWLGYTSDYLGGLISQAGIWNAELDADAVAAIYNSGTPIDLRSDSGNYDYSSNLAFFIPIEEGSGNTIYDRSVNENNGTNSGGAWSTDVP